MSTFKIPYNGRMLSKFEFLQIAFENFRPALGFALKYRNTPNFLNFFEIEFRKNSPSRGNEAKHRSASNEKRPGTESRSTSGGKFHRLNKIGAYNSPSSESKILGKPTASNMSFAEEYQSPS